jgi:AraC family transcriptional regulator of adaptative response/methylated-DNA-[protein]-cysteine methyltransferase
MSINYTIVDSYLGRLLVAATERGICAISFGDDDNKLASALSAEYPAASIARDDMEVAAAVKIILEHINGSRPHLELPLDLQATAFQLQVWQELRKIPYGATRSYREVAQAIGKPSAVRAVARACATNPVALVTPCHRVIGADGNLSGYRWGLERKRQLLSKENSRH